VTALINIAAVSFGIAWCGVVVWAVGIRGMLKEASEHDRPLRVVRGWISHNHTSKVWAYAMDLATPDCAAPPRVNLLCIVRGGLGYQVGATSGE